MSLLGTVIILVVGMVVSLFFRDADGALSCSEGVLHLDKCYIFVNMSKTWSDAQQDCVGKNGHLVTVGFQDEQAFLEDFVKLIVTGKPDSKGSVITALFIGGNDDWKEGVFRWVDATDGELAPASGDFWLSGQPDDTDHTQNGLCLDASSEDAGKWRDCHMDMEKSYICEVPASGRCDQPPVIALPNGTEITCIDIIDPSRTGRALGASQCGLNVEVAYADSVSGFSCPGAFTLQRNWSVTDVNGDVNTAVQNIKVNNIAPSITVPDDVTVSCYKTEELTPHVIGWAEGVAGCPGNSVNIVYKDYKNLTCPNKGTVERRWSVIDQCGELAASSQMIIVYSNTVTEVIQNVTYECGRTCEFLELNTPNISTCPGNEVVLKETTPYHDIYPERFCSGQSFLRTWHVVDGCGEEVVLEQRVTAKPRCAVLEDVGNVGPDPNSSCIYWECMRKMPAPVRPWDTRWNGRNMGSGHRGGSSNSYGSHMPWDEYGQTGGNWVIGGSRRPYVMRPNYYSAAPQPQRAACPSSYTAAEVEFVPRRCPRGKRFNPTNARCDVDGTCSPELDRVRPGDDGPWMTYPGTHGTVPPSKVHPGTGTGSQQWTDGSSLGVSPGQTGDGPPSDQGGAGAGDRSDENGNGHRAGDMNMNSGRPSGSAAPTSGQWSDGQSGGPMPGRGGQRRDGPSYGQWTYYNQDRLVSPPGVDGDFGPSWGMSDTDRYAARRSSYSPVDWVDPSITYSGAMWWNDNGGSGDGRRPGMISRFDPSMSYARGRGSYGRGASWRGDTWRRDPWMTGGFHQWRGMRRYKREAGSQPSPVPVKNRQPFDPPGHSGAESPNKILHPNLNNMRHPIDRSHKLQSMGTESLRQAFRILKGQKPGLLVSKKTGKPGNFLKLRASVDLVRNRMDITEN